MVDDNCAEIKQKLMKHLFHHLKISAFFNLILALYVAVYLHFEESSLINTIYWVSIMAVVVILRYLLSLRAEKLLNKSSSTKYHFLLSAVLFLTGLLWGYAYAFFYDDISVFMTMIILLIIAGVSVASSSSMAASPYCFYGFIVPIILVVLGKNIIIGGAQAYSVVFVMLTFTLFLKIIFDTNHDMLIKNITLSIKEHSLINELRKLNKKLTLFSNTDALTSLANRRYLNERLSDDWRRVKRAQRPLSFLLIDIDFFKEINDNYGHLIGDNYLKSIAKIIANQVVRATDLVARYGGDEFAVILYDTGLESAKKTAHKIQVAIKKANISNEHSPLCKRVTLSIGVSAMIPSFKANCDALILNADKALYKVKEQGRNGIGWC